MSWEDFKAKITKQYVIRDPETEALEALMDLKQKSHDVRAYNSDFKRLITACAENQSMTEKAQLTVYCKGLDRVLAAEVRVRKPADVEEAMEMAEDLTVNSGLDRAPGMFAQYGARYNKYKPSRARDDPMDLGSMEVDALEEDTLEVNALYQAPHKRHMGPSHKDRPNTVSPAEMERRRRDGLCLKCGLAGHYARDCKRKAEGNGQRRQEGRPQPK